MATTLRFENSIEDRNMLKGLIDHQPSALEQLYQRYRSILKSIVLQVVHDETEADDVLQDVLIQVWERAERYSPEKGKLLNWLATMARRRAIDRVRQHSAYRRATDRYEIACNHPDKEIDETHTVERDAHRDDLKDILQRHLGALPTAQRQAIQLAYFESKSQREISRITGAPLGTVKTRIELGMKKLAHAISGSRDKIL
jgi:RNA polymerase sigma-70 factor (ECF subfamily)